MLDPLPSHPSRPRDTQRRRDRAQFLVVTALAVAIFIITAATLANALVASNTDRLTGVGTETNHLEADLTKTIQYLTVGVERANRNPAITSRPDRRDAVNDSLTASLRAAADANSHDGGTITGRQIAITNRTTVHDGFRVTQTTTTNVTSATGATDWQLFEDADTTRLLILQAPTDSLVSVATPDNPSVPVFSVTITGRIDDSTKSRLIQVYRDGPDPMIRYETDASGTTNTCRLTDQSAVTIDAIAGTLNTTRCQAYPEFETITDVAVTNGDLVNGTYQTVLLGDARHANTTAGRINTTTAPPGPSNADTPTGHHVVYATAVRVTVSTNSGHVTKRVIVAPGSIPDPYAFLT